jgi:hypothetical protein
MPSAVSGSPSAHMISPFADLELPAIESHPVEFYEHEEAEALYEAARGQWRTTRKRAAPHDRGTAL